MALTVVSGTTLYWDAKPTCSDMVAPLKGNLCELAMVRFVSWSKTPLSHEKPDDYPAWETYTKLWTDPPFSLGKSTISTGPWLPVRKLLVYQRLYPIKSH